MDDFKILLLNLLQEISGQKGTAQSVDSKTKVLTLMTDSRNLYWQWTLILAEPPRPRNKAALR